MLLSVPGFDFKLFYPYLIGNVKTLCFNSLQNTAGNLCLLQQRVTLNCTIIIRGTNTLSMSVACLTRVIHVVTNCLVIKDGLCGPDRVRIWLGLNTCKWKQYYKLVCELFLKRIAFVVTLSAVTVTNSWNAKSGFEKMLESSKAFDTCI